MDPFNSPIQGYDGWNVNASYLTPAYMANYRPKYGNDTGKSNAFSENLSIGDSLMRMGPRDHAFGRDVLQDSSYDRYNISSGMGDAAVWGMQNVAIPAAAWSAATRFNQLGTHFGSRASMGSRAGGFMGNMASRMTTGTLSGARSMAGLGSAGSMGTGAATMMAGGSRAVGALAGGMFLPLLAAQAASTVMDKTLVDPYVSTRRGMDSMLSNTANTAVHGSGASTSGGFGMSATRAQDISQALTVAGGQDLMLETGSYNEIADNMMRAGIFQEVGDMDTTRIVDGVKKATSVLKLIQRITGDPDIKNGIQTLATLKAGGLDDINQMGVAVNQLRSASAVSGVSMQQLMSTIGNQGAIMAQQQGISANTGMLASADAFAGFTNARRSGLLSGTEVAMLGGVEGMTQNLMGGAYQTLNSGISRMIMQGGGQFGGTMSGNIQAWGGKVAGNPLASQGDWFLNQQVYKDDAMKNVGASNVILKSLQGHARSMGLDPNDANMLAAVAPSLGISPEQLRSAGLADRAAQDPLSRMRMTEARGASDISNRITEMQNNNQGLYDIPGLGGIQKTYNEMGQAISMTGATIMDPVTRATSAISDSWTEAITGTKGLESLKSRTNLITNADGTSSKVRYVGRDNSKMHTDKRLLKSDKYDELFSKLNALSSDPKLAATTKALQKAIRDGNLDDASALMKDLDVKGMMSGGSPGGFEQNAFLETFAQDVKRGAIGVESVAELDLRSPGSNLKGELAMTELLTPDKRKEALSAMIQGGRGKDIAAMYGVKSSELEGLSADQKKAAILKKALSGKMYYSEIDTGDDDKNEEAFYERFEGMGFSRTEIESYARTKGGAKSLINTDLEEFMPQGFFGTGDRTEATKKIAREIQANKEAESKRASASSTEINWSSLKDVTEGIGKLGPAVTDNTSAIQANTAVNLALLNSRGNIFSSDKTIADLMPAATTESEVKPVVKDPKYVGSYGGRG